MFYTRRDLEFLIDLDEVLGDRPVTPDLKEWWNDFYDRIKIALPDVIEMENAPDTEPNHADEFYLPKFHVGTKEISLKELSVLPRIKVDAIQSTLPNNTPLWVRFDKTKFSWGYSDPLFPDTISSGILLSTSFCVHDNGTIMIEEIVDDETQATQIHTFKILDFPEEWNESIELDWLYNIVS